MAQTPSDAFMGVTSRPDFGEFFLEATKSRCCCACAHHPPCCSRKPATIGKIRPRLCVIRKARTFHGSDHVSPVRSDHGVRLDNHNWPEPTRPDPTRPMSLQTSPERNRLDPRGLENLLIQTHGPGHDPSRKLWVVRQLYGTFRRLRAFLPQAGSLSQ